MRSFISPAFVVILQSIVVVGTIVMSTALSTANLNWLHSKFVHHHRHQHAHRTYNRRTSLCRHFRLYPRTPWFFLEDNPTYSYMRKKGILGSDKDLGILRPYDPVNIGSEFLFYDHPLGSSR